MIRTDHLRPGIQGAPGAGSCPNGPARPGNYGVEKHQRRIVYERRIRQQNVSAAPTMNESVTPDQTPPGSSTTWHEAAELFRRFRDGDSAALDDLVRLLTPVLWHVVRAYGLEQDHAEDVVQTTWLRLVRGHAKIADPQAVSSWVIVSARREAWRVAKQSKRVSAVDDDILAEHIPDAASAESHVVLTDDQRQLWAAVNTLNERCRRLLRVVAFEDRPDYASLAKDLAMPVGSIGPTRGRCLTKLREALSAQGGRP